MNKFKDALIGAIKPLYRAVPVIIGVILLVSIASTIIPNSFYSLFFKENIFIDPFIAAVLGSFLAGNPVTSYILGGEFLSLGISLIAVTAFLISWVTVGLVQLPAEILMLGKKFAISRNILSFIFSILVAILTFLILEVI